MSKVLRLRNGERALTLRVERNGEAFTLVVDIDGEGRAFPVSGRQLRKVAKTAQE